MEDMVGEKYNRLLVKEMLPKYKQNKEGRWPTYCLCDCDCGNKDIVVMASKLKSGHTQSCGCLQRERVTEAIKERSTTHGMSGTKPYAIWKAMKGRCNNKSDTHYKNYGGRGITVCDEWDSNFECFYQWLLDNGYKDDAEGRNIEHTIDRIDVNKGYSPDNCRIVSMDVQAGNKTTNRFVTYNGETHTLADWARIKGMKYKSFCNRIYRGWTFDRIMNT